MDQPQPPYQFQPPQPVPGTTPPVMPAPRSRNGLVIGLVVLAVAIIAGYFVLAQNQSWWPFSSEVALSPTPTPDSTAGWKTYSGAVFSIKYPGNLNYRVRDFDQALGFTTEAPKNGDDVTSYPISFTIAENKNLTPEQWVLQHNAGIKSSEQMNLTIDGSAAIQSPIVVGIGIRGIETFIFGNGKVVIASWLEQNGISRGIYDQILSTFRFTK